MRRTNNKRRLYESIMKDVSKTVKKRLNESFSCSYEPFTDDELNIEENSHIDELYEAINEIIKYDLKKLIKNDEFYAFMFFYFYIKDLYMKFDDELANQFMIVFINDILLDDYPELNMYFEPRELLLNTLNVFYNLSDEWSRYLPEYLENEYDLDL